VFLLQRYFGHCQNMLRMILSAALRSHRSQRGASSGTGRVGACWFMEFYFISVKILNNSNYSKRLEESKATNLN
jgi:hypothetical protein